MNRLRRTRAGRSDQCEGCKNQKLLHEILQINASVLRLEMRKTN
jgi:hypothetical protein